MTVVSSKRIPVVAPPKHRKLFGILIVGFLLFWLVFGLVKHPKVVAFCTTLIGVVSVVSIIQEKKCRRLLALDRGAPSIEKFVKKFNVRAYDPLVVRVVYNSLAKLAGGVQVYPDDVLTRHLKLGIMPHT